MLWLTLMACAGDHFFVENEGAALPVDLRGDVESGTVLVFVQGGPGLPAIDMRLVGYVDWETRLEPYVGVAYYDQRGVGNAAGDVDPAAGDFEREVRDLAAVLNAVEARTQAERLVLLSHSYGGFLALSALLEDPERVAGWIDVNGTPTYDDARHVAIRRDFAERVARGFVEAEDPAPEWAALLAWCEAHPEVDPDSPEREALWDWLDFIYEETALPEPALGVGPLLGAVFFSQYNALDSHLRGQDAVIQGLWPELEGRDLIGQLGPLTLPSLHVSGEFDDIVPTELTELVVQRMGGDDHALLQVPGAGHSPFVDAPEVFGDATLEFLSAL